MSSADGKATKQCKRLVLLLKRLGTFETTTGLNRRKSVLEDIKVLFEAFVRNLYTPNNVPIPNSNSAVSTVLPFGSYGLGVQSKGSDMDLLCVAPNHVQRSNFFTTFLEVLRSQPRVSNLTPVEESFVPLIKLNYDSIDVDLVFMRWPSMKIPNIPVLMSSENLNFNVKCLRSLNGFRNTVRLLEVVPDAGRFRMTLRAVKMWAKHRGIYGNALGFLGGYSWSILVAHICQTYADVDVAELVLKFFQVFAEWPWPKPVVVKDPSNVNEFNSICTTDVMPIITLAHPKRNSSFNVTEFTKRIIRNELYRGANVVLGVLRGEIIWDTLYEPQRLFKNFEHFVVVKVKGTAENKAQSLVETKIRLMNMKINEIPDVACVRPFPSNHSGAKNDYLQFPRDSVWLVGLKFRKSATDEKYTMQSFLNDFAPQLNLFKCNVDVNVNVKYLYNDKMNYYVQAKHERQTKRNMLVTQDYYSSFDIGDIFIFVISVTLYLFFFVMIYSNSLKTVMWFV